MAKLDLQAIQDAKDAINEDKVPHTEYMHVMMNGEMFLVPVSAVVHVVRPVPLTPVPMAPDHLIGLGNVRGQIYCIINPGKMLKLSGEMREKTKDTRYLLLRHDRVHLGLWVDAVTDLHSIPTADVPSDSGEKFERGRLETNKGSLPILRISTLFD
jgi:chemotaxis signal transduction protein